VGEGLSENNRRKLTVSDMATPLITGQGFGDFANHWIQNAAVRQCPKCANKGRSPSNESDEEDTQADIMIVDDNIFNIIPLELILKEFCGIE
jgi:hypothetical protein